MRLIHMIALQLRTPPYPCRARTLFSRAFNFRIDSSTGVSVEAEVSPAVIRKFVAIQMHCKIRCGLGTGLGFDPDWARANFKFAVNIPARHGFIAWKPAHVWIVSGTNVTTESAKLRSASSVHLRGPPEWLVRSERKSQYFPLLPASIQLAAGHSTEGNRRPPPALPRRGLVESGRCVRSLWRSPIRHIAQHRPS